MNRPGQASGWVGVDGFGELGRVQDMRRVL